LDPLSSDDEIEEEGNNEPAELSDREEYAERMLIVKRLFKTYSDLG